MLNTTKLLKPIGYSFIIDSTIINAVS